MSFLRTARKLSAIIGVNIAIAAGLLSLCELAARHAEPSLRKGTELKLQFHPYVMFTTDLAEIPKAKWFNTYTNEEVPTDIRINNMGFVADFDFTQTPSADYLKAHGKQPGEKVVLLTGGSAAQGVGATSNERTIAGRIEYYLNKDQKDVRYRVINLAMPSWISYQEFIALDLFGSQFDPSWVVVMDGSNDAATVCQLGSGPGNPMLWPAMEYFLNGQSMYSGLSDYLMKRSALFRLIVGREYSGPSPSKNYYFEEHEVDPRFKVRAHVTWASMSDQLAFYMRAETSILRLYQNTKYILSTQPIVSLMNFDAYYKAFSTSDPQQRKAYADELKSTSQSIYETYKDQPCMRNPNRPGHAYFMARSALALEQLAAESRSSAWRDVEYKNTISLFPFDEKEREKFFIDIVHLNDRGQDMLGKFYAKNILVRDGFAKEAEAL